MRDIVTEQVFVRCPLKVGDKVVWNDRNGSLTNPSIVVEAYLTYIVVYIEKIGTTMFHVRPNGHYWATWCASDEKKNGKILKVK